MPDERMSPTDQDAITTAPIIPTAGSIHIQP
jgi:hypothetical protein